MLCVPPDRPVDPLTVDVLRAVDPLARELQIPYFVVGAMARDILLTHVFGIKTGLGTRDVDFAVAVQNWPQFDLIKTRLIETGKFQAAGQTHRLLYQIREGSNGYPLDIIPFRGAEQAGNLIVWPPALAEKMNVIGYEETLTAAIQVQIEPRLLISVASLPGLALLKVFAWDDRGDANAKDARDLVTLLRNYAHTEEDRLYGDEIDVLSAVDHDFERAGARLLGSDVRRIAMPATLDKLNQLLHDERRAERLVTHMTAALPGREDIELAERLLHEFMVGLASD